MTEETTQQGPQPVGLSIQDIAGAVQVVDMASQRGAIRGDELMAIGSLRERLMAFLKAAQAQGQEVDNMPSDGPPAEEAEPEASDDA